EVDTGSPTKDMRQRVNLEHVPIPLERNAPLARLRKFCYVSRAVIPLHLERAVARASPIQEAPGHPGEDMDRALRAFIGFVRERVGGLRVGGAISVPFIGGAFVVLYRTLRGISMADVMAALQQTDPADVAVASLFVAGGYFTLTFYDLFALRTIGK